MSNALHIEVTEAMTRLIKNLWDDGFGYSHEGIVQDLRRNIGFNISVDRVRKICDEVSPVRVTKLDWSAKAARADHDNFQFNGCEEGL